MVALIQHFIKQRCKETQREYSQSASPQHTADHTRTQTDEWTEESCINKQQQSKGERKCWWFEKRWRRWCKSTRVKDTVSACRWATDRYMRGCSRDRRINSVLVWCNFTGHFHAALKRVELIELLNPKMNPHNHLPGSFYLYYYRYINFGSTWMNERKRKPSTILWVQVFTAACTYWMFRGEVRCLSQISDVIKQQLTEKRLEV